MIRPLIVFSYCLSFIEIWWAGLVACFLIIISWFWNKDMLVRFITRSKSKLKVENFLSRTRYKDKKKISQSTGWRLCGISIYSTRVILFGLFYYFGLEYVYIYFQLCRSISSWLFFFLAISLFSIIIKFYKDRALTNSINTETAGILMVMAVIFSFYLNFNNLLSLVLAFECQNMFFFYFIVIIQILRQNLNLKKLISLVAARLKQRTLWQISSLLIQYWAGFFGAIGLVLCCIFWSIIYGSISWGDLICFGWLTFIDNNLWKNYLAGILLVIGILLKGGMFPFHFWKPDLYKNLSNWGMFWYVTLYTVMFFLLIIFIIRVYLVDYCYFWYPIFWMLFISSLLLLINVLFSITEIRPFLAYMSVFHLLFILTSAVANFNTGLVYSSMYIFIYILLMVHLFSVLFIIRGKNISYLVDFQALTSVPSALAGLTCAVAAMSGIPPFLGFWGKVGVILGLYGENEYVLGTACLAAGLFLLYFYFQNYRFLGTLWSGALDTIIILQYQYQNVVFWICMIMVTNSCIIFFIGEFISWNNLLLLFNIWGW